MISLRRHLYRPLQKDLLHVPLYTTEATTKTFCTVHCFSCYASQRWHLKGTWTKQTRALNRLERKRIGSFDIAVYGSGEHKAKCRHCKMEGFRGSTVWSSRGLSCSWTVILEWVGKWSWSFVRTDRKKNPTRLHCFVLRVVLSTHFSVSLNLQWRGNFVFQQLAFVSSFSKT